MTAILTSIAEPITGDCEAGAACHTCLFDVAEDTARGLPIAIAGRSVRRDGKRREETAARSEMMACIVWICLRLFEQQMGYGIMPHIGLHGDAGNISLLMSSGIRPVRPKMLRGHLSPSCEPPRLDLGRCLPLS